MTSDTKNGDAGTLQAPYCATCPKCGSTDILRQYRKRHEEWSNAIGDYTKKETNFVSKRQYRSVAIFECITHHCKICQYEWETGVLSVEPTP